QRTRQPERPAGQLTPSPGTAKRTFAHYPGVLAEPSDQWVGRFGLATGQSVQVPARASEPGAGVPSSPPLLSASPGPSRLSTPASRKTAMNSQAGAGRIIIPDMDLSRSIS